MGDPALARGCAGTERSHCGYSGHETDATHFREEGRHRHLGRCGHLYDWRNDLRTLTMRRLIEPWTPQDDERLKAFAAQGASVVRAAAALRRRKGIVRARARKIGCPFPPLRVVRKKWANTPNNDWRDKTSQTPNSRPREMAKDTPNPHLHPGIRRRVGDAAEIVLLAGALAAIWISVGLVVVAAILG
jgi:hypothetical protein